MEWLANNWYLLIGFAAVLTLCIYSVIFFLKEPRETQIKNIKEWLKWAVSKAEAELGSGTGQLKLRLVYNMAIENFPFIAKFVTFQQFSDWVDEALDWMEDQLKKNENIKRLINGESNG